MKPTDKDLKEAEEYTWAYSDNGFNDQVCDAFLHGLLAERQRAEKLLQALNTMVSWCPTPDNPDGR